MKKHLMACCVIVHAGTGLLASTARAWDPPDGPADQLDVAYPPAPGQLLNKAHGYITQNGISILYNDGYWFAAQMLLTYQQELLNGVRYADVYRGRQYVRLKECVPFTDACADVPDLPLGLNPLASWPFAADNHYYNPDTQSGLNRPGLEDLSTWSALFQKFLFSPSLITGLRIVTDPRFLGPYTSALIIMNTEYTNALSAFHGSAVESIGGRAGLPLAMFYLGWASHLMQDQNVVHHTFDEPRRHHPEYESYADGRVTSAPNVQDSTMRGIYFKDLPVVGCEGWEGTPVCFAAWAAQQSHVSDLLNKADAEDYASGFESAMPRSQRLQAGLYAKYLTDVGLPPVHMSAVIAGLSVVQM